jgi:hypothetical protein
MSVRATGNGPVEMQEVMDSLHSFINNALGEEAKTKPSAFTRVRKLTLSLTIYLILSLVKSSTQTHLDRMMTLFGRPERKVSQQAFSKARQKLSWKACRMLHDKLVETRYGYDYETWHGYRVSAADGSKVQLPSDKGLKEIFGTVGRGGTAPTAQSSVLYDVMNNIVIDAIIAPISSDNEKTDERSLARRHFAHLINMPSFSKELLIFDRGYPSFELINDLEAAKLKYVMRARSKFNVDIDLLPLGHHPFVLEQNGETINILVVKLEIDGEIETLLSNLFDDNLTIDEFRELYFKRWPIETQYGTTKINLQLENFSSRLENGIYQDYFMTIFTFNMTSMAAKIAQPIIDAARVEKKTSISTRPI